jgi:hypothetical protein
MQHVSTQAPLIAFEEGFLTEFLHLDVTRGILPSAFSKVLEGYFVGFPPVRQDGIYGDVRLKGFFKFLVFRMYQPHDVTWGIAPQREWDGGLAEINKWGLTKWQN